MAVRRIVCGPNTAPRSYADLRTFVSFPLTERKASIYEHCNDTEHLASHDNFSMLSLSHSSSKIELLIRPRLFLNSNPCWTRIFPLFFPFYNLSIFLPFSFFNFFMSVNDIPLHESIVILCIWRCRALRGNLNNFFFLYPSFMAIYIAVIKLRVWYHFYKSCLTHEDFVARTCTS